VNGRWFVRNAWPVLAAVAGVIAVWALVSEAGWVKTSSLPSPATVWTSLVDGFRGGTLSTAAGKTLLRLAVGFGIGISIGTLLGTGLAASSLARRSVGALVSGMRAVPPVAWLPLAIVWFGLTERAVVFMVIIAGFPSVAIATANSLRQVPPLLVRAGRTLGATGWTLLRRVIFPAALPGYVSGLQVAWVSAWWALLAGELITHSARAFGLGQELLRAQLRDQTAQVLAILVVIILIGMVVDLVIFGLIDRRIRMRRGLTLR